MLTVTQIKRLLDDNKLRPNKRLGQNFIIDKNIVHKLLGFAGISKEDIILEIGAGLGNITLDLAALAKNVIAIEFDKGLCRAAKGVLKAYKNIQLVCQDILELDIKGYAEGRKLKIVGNLPYYITTPILERIIENRFYIQEALLMVQREFADRMLAWPGSKAYGSLACYLGYFADLEFKSVVKKSSFYPKPEVDSALIRLKVLDRPRLAVRDEGLFFKIIRASFNQRRKTILSSLFNKGISRLNKDSIGEILERSIGSSKRRPETISLEEFARISNGFPA